jgi:hypothetical protein
MLIISIVRRLLVSNSLARKGNHDSVLFTIVLQLFVVNVALHCLCNAEVVTLFGCAEGLFSLYCSLLEHAVYTDRLCNPQFIVYAACLIQLQHNVVVAVFKLIGYMLCMNLFSILLFILTQLHRGCSCLSYILGLQVGLP